MEKKKELIEILTYTNLEKVKEIFETIDLNKYYELAEDTMPVVKAIFSVYGMGRKWKFESFLKKYSVTINKGENLDEQSIIKIQKYMENDRNLEFMVEIIDSAINAKSTKCASLLGFYAGCMLKKIKNIEYKDMIVINALKEMNDYDIEYFCKLYDVLENSSDDEDSVITMHGNRVRVIYKESMELLPFNVLVVGQKFKNLQIINYDEGTIMPNEIDNFIGVLTEVSDYLYKIINKCFMTD